jgi:hypothetical protein
VSLRLQAVSYYRAVMGVKANRTETKKHAEQVINDIQTIRKNNGSSSPSRSGWYLCHHPFQYNNT